MTADASDTIAPFTAPTLDHSSTGLDFSFDFFTESAAGGNANPYFSIVFAPASAPWASGSNDNYGNCFGVVMNRDSPTNSQASIGAYVGLASNGAVYYPEGFMAAGAWHHLLIAGSNIGNGQGTCTAWIDGTRLFQMGFYLSDPRGINSVEIYKTGTGANNAGFDDIFVGPVPEPATIFGLTAGCLALMKRRLRVRP
ncbi:MAG TPA: PEP-CTERM sorting domain-containing protein [Fimbriimonadaceae bacterium]|nr:PEP-CTERM sorting domain-containing protein [Fimbriimonadaceae bacterium]